MKLILGLLLLAVAVRMWLKRPRGDAVAELPSWMKTIDTFTTPRALAMGVALSAVNPKNLVLVVAAAAAIAQTGIPGGDQAVALAVFVVIGTVGPGLPVAIYSGMGERSAQILAGLRKWMGRNNGAIMAVIALVIGAKLIGDGIASL